ncbi:MAG: hypothetical protein AB1656_26815 [Candidatus Omnitrophota bacterium]
MASKVGIFWFFKISGSVKIKSFQCELREAESWNGFRSYCFGHSQKWPDAVKEFPELGGSDFRRWPRGRVLWNENSRKFEIVMAVELLGEDKFKDLIIEEFALYGSSKEFLKDVHYKISKEVKEMFLGGDG